MFYAEIELNGKKLYCGGEFYHYPGLFVETSIDLFNGTHRDATIIFRNTTSIYLLSNVLVGGIAKSLGVLVNAIITDSENLQRVDVDLPTADKILNELYDDMILAYEKGSSIAVKLIEASYDPNQFWLRQLGGPLQG